MASHLDLEEQEQLDQLKHFWAKFGNLLTWVLLIVLTAYAGWNGWQYWQRDQAAKAGGIYDELERSAQAGDADRVSKVWADLQARYPATAFAEQGGLLAAKAQFDKGQADAARGTLEWVAANAKEDEYRAIARLRLAGVHLEAKRYDEAMKLVSSDVPEAWAGLAADRRGDILQAQGKTVDAVTAYQQAWTDLGREVDYRRLVEAKLVALGAAPQEDTAASGAAR
jgi:predicted negative regulator of RcsB-dependent stress response